MTDDRGKKKLGRRLSQRKAEDTNSFGQATGNAQGMAGGGTPSNRFEDDEIPSIIRHANDAFQNHQRVKSNSDLKPTSYHPNYQNQVSASDPNWNQDRYFDDLFGEIIRQKNNIREKKPGILSIKTDRATKIRIAVLAVILIVAARMRAQQDDNRMTYDRLEQVQQAIQDGEIKEGGTERKKLFKEVGKAKYPSGLDIPSQEVKTKSLSAKAPINQATTEIDKNALKLAIWKDLLTCAGESIWSGYHSAEFIRIHEDLFILGSGDAVFAFTPYYAGKQTIFGGWFWQVHLHAAAKLAGRDLTSKFPTKVLEFPYTHVYGRGGRNHLDSTFYVKLRRGGTVVGIPAYRIGQSPKNAKASSQFIQMHEQTVMWVQDFKFLREEYMVKLLEEVEYQVKRFNANDSKPWNLVSYSRNSSSPWNSHVDYVLKSCQNAGRVLESPDVEKTAFAQRQKLRQNPSALWYPTVFIEQVNLNGNPAGGSYWYPLKYSSQPLRDCLLRQRVPVGKAFAINLNLHASGQPQSFGVQPLDAPSRGIEACLKGSRRHLRFPASEESIRNLSFDLRYQ